jgi:hypothetical protein
MGELRPDYLRENVIISRQLASWISDQRTAFRYRQSLCTVVRHGELCLIMIGSGDCSLDTNKEADVVWNFEVDRIIYC